MLSPFLFAFYKRGILEHGDTGNTTSFQEMVQKKSVSSHFPMPSTSFQLLENTVLTMDYIAGVIWQLLTSYSLKPVTFFL